ncbi:hypothetical protein FKW77_000807 [Venturia effusa]|uniref:SnoaL-like domain-containing protein n=1 Tax=Venturia effusa TaxID=50376 RepID=A0A517L8I4_9PEZI|nr:hypothetical protein FKW77_000807 [Venturia effusa]
MAAITPRTSRYPSRDEIASIFHHLETGEFNKTWAHFSPDVDCVVTHSHPCSGHFTTFPSYYAATIERMGHIWKEMINLMIRNVVGGGEQEWACIEIQGTAECKNGLPFENEEVMMVRFDEKGVIVQMRVYVDSALVTRAVEENEGKI